MDQSHDWPRLLWQLASVSFPFASSLLAIWSNLMIHSDYSQAIDVGSLKGVNAATVRILIWVLSFMAHGYATEEFEVTEERLGCYR